MIYIFHDFLKNGHVQRKNKLAVLWEFEVGAYKIALRKNVKGRTPGPNMTCPYKQSR